MMARLTMIVAIGIVLSFVVVACTNYSRPCEFKQWVSDPRCH